jgi:hypothetical protein
VSDPGVVEVELAAGDEEAVQVGVLEHVADVEEHLPERVHVPVERLRGGVGGGGTRAVRTWPARM